MNPATLVVMSFGVVTAVTFLVGYLLLQRLPTVGRERLRPTVRDPGIEDPGSILRWGEDIGPAWQRIAASARPWDPGIGPGGCSTDVGWCGLDFSTPGP
jgi:hypothetical protein